jgi:ABC-type phosphate/phosphonate transport system substrate-binding protein
MLFTLAGEAQTAAPGSVRIRIGASSSVVLNGQLNPNDARAAIITWADALSRETPVRFETPPDVLLTPQQILQLLKQGELDAFTATTPEYLQLAQYADPSIVLVNDPATMGGEEFILLVHADSGIKTIADLRGRRLLHLTGTIMYMAWDWMETMFAAANLPPPETYLAQLSTQAKVARTVLPVFFRQADACLVYRRVYDNMCELNPQLAKSLRVLAASPRVVPVLVGMRKGCTQQQKDAARTALTGLSHSVRGNQILAVFGGTAMVATDASVLNKAIELTNSARAIRAKRGVK